MPEPLFPAGHDGPGRDDHAEAVLRRVLDAQAAAARPGPAPRVDDLVARSAPRRWPTALGVAAAVAALAVTSAVALRTDDTPVPVAGPSETPSASVSAGPTAEPSTTPSTEPSSAPSAAPTTSAPAPTPGPVVSPTSSSPGGQATRVVVWSCLPDDDGTDLRVSPESRTATLPTGTGMTDGEAKISAAVGLLDSSPPLDPDYVNYWSFEAEDAPAPEPADVQVTDAGTTVDFSAIGLSGLATGATFPCLTETLVRTVVSNGGTAPVTYLVDGEPAAFAELDFSEPASPDKELLTGGWILDPYEGQRLPAGTVTLSGTATAFEATVQWRVLDEDGAVAAEGFTQAGSNGEYGPWTVPVDLAPGTYTAELWAEDMSGEATRIWEDTKTFTVVR